MHSYATAAVKRLQRPVADRLAARSGGMDADIDDEATRHHHQSWLLDRLVQLRVAIGSLDDLPALLRNVSFEPGEPTP